MSGAPFGFDLHPLEPLVCHGDGKDGAPVGIVTKAIEKSGKATQ